MHEHVADLPDEERQAFIWDRIIYANPIKANERSISSIRTSRW